MQSKLDRLRQLRIAAKHRLVSFAAQDNWVKYYQQRREIDKIQDHIDILLAEERVS